MKFIFNHNSLIKFDFETLILKSNLYYRWNNVDYIIGDISNEHCLDDNSYCPVGSIEFTTEWLQRHLNIQPKPRNVPEILFDKLSRKIYNISKEGDLNLLDYSLDLDSLVYVKSNDLIKSPYNFVYLWSENSKNGKCSINCLPLGNYQVSEYIVDEFESEWRVFMYKGEIVDMRRYLGDPFSILPRKEWIEDIILTWKNDPKFPISGTIDIGMIGEKEELIEVHDIFSCGLYGFNDLKLYPNMVWDWYNNLKKKINYEKSNSKSNN